jgi:hypothetical protein
MKRRYFKIFTLSLLIILTYTTLVYYISNSLPNRYGTEMNGKRTELGLNLIQGNWKLDSIESFEYIENEISISKFILQIKNEKLFCQHWSNQNLDTLKPYLKEKKIYYTKSFWLWKNRIEAENEYFINPKSKYEKIVLDRTYDFGMKKWYNSIDTLATELKILQDFRRADSLGNHMYFCATGDINESSILSNSETIKVLKNWKLK